MYGLANCERTALPRRAPCMPRTSDSSRMTCLLRSLLPTSFGLATLPRTGEPSPHPYSEPYPNPNPNPNPNPSPSPNPNPNPTPNPNPNPNPNRLADVTWWGPRDRLRCTTTSQPGGVISSGRTTREIVTPSAAVRRGLGPSANARANARANATANANAHANANAAGDTSAILVLVLLLLATYQVRCLERVRSALGPAARLFVAVDAPKLQAIVFDELGARAFITPGT